MNDYINKFSKGPLKKTFGVITSFKTNFYNYEYSML